MIQEMHKNDEYAELTNDGFDEELLAEFSIHTARSLRIAFNHPNLVGTVANRLTTELAEQWVGDTVPGDENFAVEDEAERILDKHKISHAADSTFVTTALFSELIADDIRLARSHFNASNARQEIQRIASRLAGNDWQAWLRQTANETAQEIYRDFSFLPFQRRQDCLAFVNEELRQLLTRLSARQNECAERQAQLGEQQRNNRRQQNAQSVNNQPEEAKENLLARMRRGAGGLLDLNRYLPGRSNGAAQNQPAVDHDSFDPIESFLAQTEFEIAAAQIESTFYNLVLDVLGSHMQILDASLTNSRKKYAALSSANAKLEAKRSFGLHGGEMLLNSSELTEATIQFLAPDAQRKDFLLAELREKINSVMEECDGDVRDSDVEEMTGIIADAVAEKLSDFCVADAMTALLEFQPTFETQIHEAIKQTAATDFLASGWYQFLTPKLNYFAAVSYLPSVYAETNERLNEVVGRIAASLPLKYEMKNESLDSNREDFCFYIEYFCLPVESLEFYEQNIAEFEKVKDLPEYNPHFYLYK